MSGDMSGDSNAHRVVVAGHGMVAARFVEELQTLAAPGAVAVTVLGAEPHLPYNRLLLSEVIAGRANINALTLPAASEPVVVRTDTTVVSIDRAAKAVTDADGVVHDYDTLVLATGAEPRVPLPTDDLRGVRTLRTIDDCRDLAAAARPGRRITVLGGGLLGIELACGLAHRGAEVTVVHRTPALMDRQLDAAAAQVLADSLRAQGIGVLLDVEVVDVIGHDGAVCGLRTADGAELPSDLVVASAGVVPRTELACAAGLPVEHGIVVGVDLRSPEDPAVAAIGDCAQEEGRWTGMLAPGWEQARRLAHDLVGRPVRASGSADAVVTLKARGLSVVTMGAAGGAGGAGRTVTLSDPGAGRHVSVEVAADRVVAATCIGAPDLAADLTAAFERRTPTPKDPTHLLFAELPTGTGAGQGADRTNLATMPGNATVCRCNGVTKREIVGAHAAGDRDVEAVAARTRATTGCGGCASAVGGLLAWMEEVDPPSDTRPANATPLSTPAAADAHATLGAHPSPGSP
ncbi:FAD-dependent oxidoreductase [Yimella radicis]